MIQYNLFRPLSFVASGKYLFFPWDEIAVVADWNSATFQGAPIKGGRSLGEWAFVKFTWNPALNLAWFNFNCNFSEHGLRAFIFEHVCSFSACDAPWKAPILQGSSSFHSNIELNWGLDEITFPNSGYIFMGIFSKFHASSSRASWYFVDRLLNSNDWTERECTQLFIQ